MSTSQAGILADLPDLSRYLEFNLLPDSDPAPVLRDLAARNPGAEMVIGIGSGLVSALKGSVPGMRAFPAMSGPGRRSSIHPGGCLVLDQGHRPGRNYPFGSVGDGTVVARL